MSIQHKVQTATFPWSAEHVLASQKHVLLDTTFHATRDFCYSRILVFVLTKFLVPQETPAFLSANVLTVYSNEDQYSEGTLKNV